MQIWLQQVNLLLLLRIQCYMWRITMSKNVYNMQGQAALSAATDVIKEYVWFINVICFFTVGSMKFLQL